MSLFSRESEEIRNLFIAINKKDVNEVRRIILDHPDMINQETSFGATALQYASCFYIPHYDIISPLIENSYQIIKFLIEFGADVNKKDQIGETAFFIFCKNISAAENDKLETPENCCIIMEIVKLFLNNGANIHIKNDEGSTILHELFCATFSNVILKITEELIKRGINVNEKNNYNQTAIEKEMEYIFEEIVDETHGVDFTEDLSKMIELLEENGAELEFNDKFGKILKPILRYKLKKKDEEIAKLKKEIEELRYKPGNPGYFEAMQDFEDLKEKKNE